MTLQRGDVCWWEGAGGRRPAVVLTRNSAIPLLSRVVVAPASRTIRGVPSEIRLSVADGMKSDCVLSLDNVRVVPKRALKGRITSLSPERLDELCEALRFSLGC